MVRVASYPHHRDGPLVHPPAHRLLRGQWAPLAPLALPADSRILAGVSYCGAPDSRVGAVAASAHCGYLIIISRWAATPFRAKAGYSGKRIGRGLNTRR